ncbi:MAG: hypothetical protein WD182_02865, partial [Bacteroidota bacterium]
KQPFFLPWLAVAPHSPLKEERSGINEDISKESRWLCAVKEGITLIYGYPQIKSIAGMLGNYTFLLSS